MLKSISKIAAAASLCLLAQMPAQALADEAAVIGANEVMFGPADPAHPDSGEEIAVLAGDPSKPGPFVVRFRVKAGTMDATHKHSMPEYVSVLSGKALMSFGEKPDKSKAVTLTAGSFMYLPGGQYHTLWVEEDAIADLYAMGPFDQTYAATQ
jgi:mannose-6-phosphate isomerase-like protein (cupin superfamily)